MSPAALCTPFDEATLEKIEAELTRDVPQILEAMNQASDELNRLENDAAVVQRKHNRCLADLTCLTEQNRVLHGQTFEEVRPFFSAIQRGWAASQQAQVIVRDFTAASTRYDQAADELHRIEAGLFYGAHSVSLDSSQQDDLSRATVKALKCQQERDQCEREYAVVLKEYEKAKAAAEKCRTVVGNDKVQKIAPCFRKMQQVQLELDEIQKVLSLLQDDIKSAKSTYKDSMASLDRISTSVHDVRREYKAFLEVKGPSNAAEAGETDCPELDHPVPEDPTAFQKPLDAKTTIVADTRDVIEPTNHGSATPEISCPKRSPL